MMKKKLRWLMMSLLAALLVSAAGAAEVDAEQVLLDGDKAVYTPVRVEQVEINGTQAISEMFPWFTNDCMVSKFHVNNMEIPIGNAELADLLLQLSPQQRDILLLYYIAGYGDAEIAQLLKRCKSAVNANRNRALKQLLRFWNNE